jgi:hypothetical protein
VYGAGVDTPLAYRVLGRVVPEVDPFGFCAAQ